MRNLLILVVIIGFLLFTLALNVQGGEAMKRRDQGLKTAASRSAHSGGTTANKSEGVVNKGILDTESPGE